jgi:hypothetical protein
LEFVADDKRITSEYTDEQPRAVGETVDIVFLPEFPEEFLLDEQLADSLLNAITPFRIIVAVILLLIEVAQRC